MDGMDGAVEVHMEAGDAAVFVDSKREKNDEPWFVDSWATRGALAAA